MEECGGDFQDQLSISKIKINISEFFFSFLDIGLVEIVLSHFIS